MATLPQWIEARVIQKIATEAEWNAITLVPYKGEFCIVGDNSGKVYNIKVGDGVNTFPNLDYMFDSIQQNVGYIAIESNALPTPEGDVAWGMVTGGTYTFGGSTAFTVPDGHWGIANYSSEAWSLVDMGELPETYTDITLVDENYPSPVIGDPVALEGELIGYVFQEGMPVENGGVSNLFDYVTLQPNTRYVLRRKSGLGFPPSLRVYNNDKTDSRRVLDSSQFPVDTPVFSIQFETGDVEGFAMNYSRYPGYNDGVSFYDDYDLIEEAPGDVLIELKEKEITGSEIVRRSKSVLKVIEKETNSIKMVSGGNQYDGLELVNKGFRVDIDNGTIVDNVNNNISSLIPVSVGKISISAPGFALGLVSTTVFGYENEEYSNGVRLSPSGTTDSFEIDIPIGINFIATQTRITSFSGQSNAQYLLVSLLNEYEITSGGDSVKSQKMTMAALSNNEVVERLNSISKKTNYIEEIAGENQYDGNFTSNVAFNSDGTIYNSTNNDISSLIPVKTGEAVISAPGFEPGVVSTTVFGYPNEEYSDGIRLHEAGSAPSVTIYVPENINYIATQVRIFSFGGQNNSEYLLVTQKTGNYKIVSGGDEVNTNEIIGSVDPDQVRLIAEEVYEENNPDKPVVFDEYPYYDVQSEPDADTDTAPVKDPSRWKYKDIILNVFESMRTSNPGYISLIGDYEQTIDEDLPTQSIGLSKTNGSRQQYPLFLYDFKPEGYEQTVLIISCEHGNEQEATMSLCRFLQIMMSESDNSPQMNYFRTKVRFLISPVLNPWGYDTNNRQNAANVDMNRNYDFNFESYDNSNYGDFSGVVPPPMAQENGLLYEAIKPFLNEINYGFSLHTGWVNNVPYWINSPIDAANRKVVETVGKWLCDKNSVPFNIRGMHGEINYIAASAHYFSKIHMFPFSTVDYVANYPEWGSRFKSKAMTVFVEQIINLLIGHSYENINAVNNESTVNSYKPLIYPTPVSEEFGHYQKLSAEMVDEIFTSKATEFSKEVIGQSGLGYDVLSFTYEPENFERTVIVIGGYIASTGIKHVFNYAEQDEEFVNFSDGQRHVVMLSDFAKFWSIGGDDFILESKSKTKLIIIPVADVNSVYGEGNVSDWNDSFPTGSTGSYQAIKNVIAQNPGAKLVMFNEVSEPDEMFTLRFSKNYPYGWKSGSPELKSFIDFYFDAPIVSTYSVSNNVLSWAAENYGVSGVEINNMGSSANDYAQRTWSTKNMTLLGKLTGNIIGLI